MQLISEPLTEEQKSFFFLNASSVIVKLKKIFIWLILHSKIIFVNTKVKIITYFLEQ